MADDKEGRLRRKQRRIEKRKIARGEISKVSEKARQEAAAKMNARLKRLKNG
jgi:hypothetical protein